MVRTKTRGEIRREVRQHVAAYSEHAKWLVKEVDKFTAAQISNALRIPLAKANRLKTLLGNIKSLAPSVIALLAELADEQTEN